MKAFIKRWGHSYKDHLSKAKRVFSCTVHHRSGKLLHFWKQSNNTHPNCEGFKGTQHFFISCHRPLGSCCVKHWGNQDLQIIPFHGRCPGFGCGPAGEKWCVLSSQESGKRPAPWKCPPRPPWGHSGVPRWQPPQLLGCSARTPSGRAGWELHPVLTRVTRLAKSSFESCQDVVAQSDGHGLPLTKVKASYWRGKWARQGTLTSWGFLHQLRKKNGFLPLSSLACNNEHLPRAAAAYSDPYSIFQVLCFEQIKNLSEEMTGHCFRFRAQNLFCLSACGSTLLILCQCNSSSSLWVTLTACARLQKWKQLSRKKSEQCWTYSIKGLQELCVTN